MDLGKPGTLQQCTRMEVASPVSAILTMSTRRCAPVQFCFIAASACVCASLFFLRYRACF